MSSITRYEPRGAVLDLFRRKDNEILISGAAGTGKSVGALTKVHFACLKTPNVRALIVRKTHSSLTASTLVTFRQKVAAEAITAGLLHFYGGSAQEPASFRYANGSVIVVGGLDRASRLLSTEYDLVFIDEATETTAEDVDTIVTRLRNGRLSYQQLLMATNPGAPTHHLKQRADSGKTVILYSRHEDNPRMYDNGQWTRYGQEYLNRLDSLSGVRRERLRFGRWAAADGLIYDDYDPAVHLMDPFPIPDAWPRWWSIDFGYTNPFVCQWWATDPDGRLYLYREIYMTRRTVDQHAATIAKQVMKLPQKPSTGSRWTGEWKEPRPQAIICDHDAEGRMVLQRELGLPTKNANKKVTEGIQAAQKRLRKAGDTRPRLFIFRDTLVERDTELEQSKRPCCTADEITGYIWDQTTGDRLKEVPRKQDDHGMDALRYLVADRDLRGSVKVRFV